MNRPFVVAAFLFAATSSLAAAKFEPPEGKTLLFIGQDLDSIKAYLDVIIYRDLIDRYSIRNPVRACPDRAAGVWGYETLGVVKCQARELAVERHRQQHSRFENFRPMSQMAPATIPAALTTEMGIDSQF